MATSNQFFKATPEQTKALRLLILILASIFFWPSIQWITSAVFRRSLIRTDQLAAEIPRSWVAVEKDSELQAWTPCITILCPSQPRSSVEIRFVPKLAGRNNDWPAVVEELSQRTPFPNAATETRTFASPDGVVHCLEATNNGIINSSCFVANTGIVAGFHGLATDLNDFYAMVATARTIGKGGSAVRTTP